MFYARRSIGSIVAMAAFATLANAQQPANLGFELRESTGAPAAWRTAGERFEIVVDSTGPRAGAFSLRTRWVAAAPYDSKTFAMAAQTVPVIGALGRKLHLTGYIRTDNIRAGYAGFWIRIDGEDNRFIALENMQRRGARGTTPWTRYDIELPVDSSAVRAVFGVLHPGDGTAWFDSLTLEVVGPAMPRAAAARPPEEMARLLTDAELALPPDSVTVLEDSSYTAWIRTHARPIRSLGASDFSDLRFFAPLLANKRIVQLGESGHGVAEFSMAKVRLIKYLHEQLGYDVIAFESSLYECNRAQHSVASLSPDQLLRSCIFPVWDVSEVLPLFEYIKQTQSTARPLILAGFDEQISTRSVHARPALLRSLVAPIDSVYAKRVYETDSLFVATHFVTRADLDRDRLVAFYDSLAAFLRDNRKAIDAAHPDDPQVAVVARQAALSMSVYVRNRAAAGAPAGTAPRDSAMADNLDVLLNEIYPDKKFIVWAHNFHIQHRGTSPNATSIAVSSPRTMGTWVVARHRPKLYTIGLFMYRGHAAGNTGRTYPIAQSRSGSLESILHRAPWRYSFVDFSQAPRGPGSEWMWKTIDALSWGMQRERLVPRDEYDGVLFIDMVHPPHYRRTGRL